MATAKQLAALAKARAARKKKLGASTKKTATKKRVGTSQKKPSQLTKKAPSKRLKARRAKNVTPGYYPNPAKKHPASNKWDIYLQKGGKGKKYFLHLIAGQPVWKTEKYVGYDLDLLDELVKTYGRKALRQLPSGWGVYVDKKK